MQLSEGAALYRPRFLRKSHGVGDLCRGRLNDARVSPARSSHALTSPLYGPRLYLEIDPDRALPSSEEEGGRYHDEKSVRPRRSNLRAIERSSGSRKRERDPRWSIERHTKRYTM